MKKELTVKEREVLELSSYGWDRREVGVKLHIHRDTVRGRLTNIYKKLGVQNKTHAVAEALRQGIIQ